MGEYQVVERNDSKELELAVRIEMLSDWQPIGGVSVTRVGDGDFVYSQSMVKQKKADQHST